jgi:hypothetical protein
MTIKTTKELKMKKTHTQTVYSHETNQKIVDEAGNTIK